MSQNIFTLTAPFRGIMQLSRWKEQLPFVSLTLLGGLTAFSLHGVMLDWRLLAVAIANFLTVTFAFMINDIEDADDDAKNPVSARRNPITNRMLDKRTAWVACGVTVMVALLLYVQGGRLVVLVGGLNLLLSFLYSWKPVRLKSSSFGLDIVSHTLMLGGLLPLAGYFIYSTEPANAILLMAAAAILGSTYGQIYNQVRDFESDKSAGIINLTIRLGKPTAMVLMYTAAGLTFAAAGAAALQLTFPSWTVQAVFASALVGLASTIFTQNDASGKPALDITGRLQGGFWIAFNLLMALWVVWAMGWL